MTAKDSNDSDSGKESTRFIQRSDTLRMELKQAKQQDACLILIRGFPQGQRYFLSKPEMIAGREQSCEIALLDQSISRKHAIIKQTDKEVTITDLGSSNGTFINDKKIEAHQTKNLNKEDILQLGNLIFKFLPAGELETLYLGNMATAAYTDALTSIHNKAYLMQILEAESKRSFSLKSPMSLIFFDIDFFKKINDGFGHDAGDYVLKTLSKTIKEEHIRDRDIFARYGGEEFVIILLNTEQTTGELRAEQIRKGIESQVFTYETKNIPVTISLGVTSLDLDKETDITEILKQADQALYQAKNAGRNQVKTYQPRTK
jgi:diguanylate cyclase (GGDEF)-like protein